MSRLDRRKRELSELGIKSSGGMLDLFDNAVKETYRLNDDEYDFIAERITDNEADIFLNMKLSFKDKRKVLKILDKYLKLYNHENK